MAISRNLPVKERLLAEAIIEGILEGLPQAIAQGIVLAQQQQSAAPSVPPDPRLGV